MYDLPFAKAYLGLKEKQYAYDAIKYGWGKKSNKYISIFENKFKNFLGTKFSISTSSCTGALHIALRALNISVGDEIIIPEITWIATAAAVTYEGATPILAKVDAHNWCIDTKDVENKITKNTKAIIAVHLYGNICDIISLKKIANKLGNKMKIIIPVHFGGVPCEMDSIKKIADNSNAVIIEDAAHALGSFYKNGKRVGCCDNSLMTIFSFHPVKSITTGEGGAVTTNNKSYFKKIRLLRSHGIIRKKNY